MALISTLVAAALVSTGGPTSPPVSPGVLQIESELVIFEGQGHILDYEYDESIFYDFWLAH